MKITHPSNSGVPRKYPLRHLVADLYESVGVQRNPDLNSGEVLGYGEICSSTFEGKRQWASQSYKLGPNVEVLTNAQVELLLFADERVSGVKITVSGSESCILEARKEVIVCAGAVGSAKLLLLR